MFSLVLRANLAEQIVTLEAKDMEVKTPPEAEKARRRGGGSNLASLGSHLMEHTSDSNPPFLEKNNGLSVLRHVKPVLGQST